MYDWFLGGKDNYPVDEADGPAAARPGPPGAGRWRGSTARSCTAPPAGWPSSGVRQFLDIGTGIPTEPNLHQIAQETAPGRRVVYCDNDPIVLAHAAALLRCTPEGVTDYVQADARDPDAILEGGRKILDFDRPVALSLIALLHFVSDEDGAHDLVRPAAGRTALRQLPGDVPRAPPTSPRRRRRPRAMYKAAGMTLALRSRGEFTRFFDGLELVEPGVEVPHRWHPELGEPVPGQADGVDPGLRGGRAEGLGPSGPSGSASGRSRRWQCTAQRLQGRPVGVLGRGRVPDHETVVAPACRSSGCRNAARPSRAMPCQAAALTADASVPGGSRSTACRPAATPVASMCGACAASAATSRSRRLRYRCRIRRTCRSYAPGDDEVGEAQLVEDARPRLALALGRQDGADVPLRQHHPAQPHRG